MAALRQINNPQGITMYVVRVLADGSSGLSKPCPACHKALVEAGVKKVIYSDDTTWEP